MNDENQEINSQKTTTKPTSPLLFIGVLVLLLVVAGGYYFYSMVGTRGQLKAGSADISNTANLQGDTNTSMPVTLGEDVSGNGRGQVENNLTSTEIVIEASSFKFMPASFNVKSGQPVKLTFNNLEGFHDLVFDDLSIKTKQIMAGDIDTVEFTAPTTPGEYTFFCSVGQHRQLGMIGKMIVE